MKVEEKQFEKGELIFTPNRNKMLLEAVMKKSKIIYFGLGLLYSF